MEYITVEEAAELGGVSVATMRRRCGAGEVDAVKAGAQWLIDPKSVGGAKPARKRKPKGVTEEFNLKAAWGHVQSTDLSEAWVPDVLRFRDYIEVGDKVVETAGQRLVSLAFSSAFRLDIPKTTASNRPGVLLDISDRVAYQAVVGSFAKKIEMKLAESVYSSRLATGRHFLQHGPKRWVRFEASVKKQAKGDGFSWVASADISAYFEHIHHRILFEELSHLGVSGQPLRALRVMLTRWSQLDGVGLPQGPNASRVLGNFYLVQVDESMLGQDYVYHRYMDDVRILAKTKADAVAAIRQFEHLCRQRGLICSSSKTDVVSIEEYIRQGDGNEKNIASYFFNSGDLSKARPVLKRILKGALSQDRINQRDARFSLWRLARIREHAALRQILERLEDLAPLASVVGAYLKYFVSRESVQKKISEFMSDPLRSYSAFLKTWIFAAMLECNNMPKSWTEISRQEASDKNNPNFLRAVASCVLAKARLPRDISWIRGQLDVEHDPDVLRAYLVALKYGGALDKSSIAVASGRVPGLERTGEWLRARRSLPSLLYPDQVISVP